MNALRVIRYAFETGWIEYRQDTWLPGWLIRTVAQAAFFAMLGQLLDSPQRLEFLLIGNIVIVGALATAFVVPVSTWDRFDGTYALLVVAPTSLLLPTIGRTLPRLAGGVGTSLVAFCILALMFDIPTPWPEVLAFLPLMALTCASCYCFMLLLGALANLAPNGRNFAHNIATMSLMAFCGVNLPVSYWPDSIQVIANVLPVTHGLAAVRHLLASDSLSSIMADASAEAIVGIIWLVVAFLTVDRMAESGRKSGSIDFTG